VHSSSLVSTRLAPERAAGESKTGGPNGTGSASLTDAEIHGSSLVATRLAPSSKSETPKAKRATNTSTPTKSATQSVSSFATRVKPGAKGGTPLLYVSPTCPHAHKAWLAALESGTEFDIRFEDLSAKSANLQDAFMDGTYEPEPLVAKVPVLKHEGRTLVESLLVASYVAKEFKSDVEYADATEAYAGSLFASQFNALTPLYMQALKAKSVTELNNKLDALRAQLRQCERALAIAQAHTLDAGGAPGPFACGARFTLAEVTTCTMIPRLALVLGHYRGFRLHKEIEDAGLVRLGEWVDACVERPSFKQSTSRASEVTGKDYGSALIDFSGKFVSWTGK
jgi:glutathione S-transferase